MSSPARESECFQLQQPPDERFFYNSEQAKKKLRDQPRLAPSTHEQDSLLGKIIHVSCPVQDANNEDF